MSTQRRMPVSGFAACARGRFAIASGLLLALIGALTPGRGAHADNFATAYYDPGTGQLVVVMRYRGTNPDHTFSVKWGPCMPGRDGGPSEVSGEVLDDQWQDRALRDFKKTARFGLSDLPCRPAKVTLRTAPRFYYSVMIPG